MQYQIRDIMSLLFSVQIKTFEFIQWNNLFIMSCVFSFVVENMLNLYLRKKNDILPETLMCFSLKVNFVWDIKNWFY